MLEIGVVLLLALLLFPARELPKLARSIARAYGTLRRSAEDFRSAILQDEDLRRPLDDIRGAYNDARFEVHRAEAEARKELERARLEARLASKRLEKVPGRVAADEASIEAPAEEKSTKEEGGADAASLEVDAEAIELEADAIERDDTLPPPPPPRGVASV